MNFFYILDIWDIKSPELGPFKGVNYGLYPPITPL